MKNHYKFPVIRNIKDVLPLIADRKEFAVTEKEGGYTVINYHVQMDSTFPPVESDAEAILRELRGIIFSTKTGEVISRRYHKFFNAGEREEASVSFIDLSQPHVILEKLDGSMITPLIANGVVRWGTKMGVTDVSRPVEEFINSHEEYDEFAKIAIACGMTPIFEWCSRKQKIVLDYAEDQLILTAMRNTVTGEYVRHLVLEVVGATHNIPVVKAYQGTAENMRGLMDAVATMENTEGFVVRFDDGHMAKVKCEWYVQLHRAKDVTKFEKNVLEIILEEKADDLLPLLEEPFKTMVIKYRDDVYTGIHEVADFMESEYQRILLALDYTKEKRRFAVHGVKNHSMTQFHSFFFTRFDKGDGMMGQLIGALKKSCSSQNRLDNNRWMMNGVTYNMAVSGDE